MTIETLNNTDEKIKEAHHFGRCFAFGLARKEHSLDQSRYPSSAVENKQVTAIVFEIINKRDDHASALSHGVKGPTLPVMQ